MTESSSLSLMLHHQIIIIITKISFITAHFAKLNTHTHTSHSKPRPLLLPLLLPHLLRRPLPQQPLQNLPRSILGNRFDKSNPSLWLLVIN